MLPDPEDRETPDVEDPNANDDQGESGHDEPSSDEELGGEDDGDAGGRAEHDGEDDASGADEGEERQSAEVTARRGNPEFGRLRRERREANERADRAERELQALRATQPRRSQEEIAAERRARLELMSPDEKTDFLVSEARQETRNEIAQIRFEQADARDAARFDVLCARNSVFADLADEVERELGNLRRGGGNSSREVIAKYLLGDRAVKAAEKRGKEQRQQAQRRVQRQMARPGNSQSDRTGGDERRGGSEREKRAKRLDGILL